MKALSPISISGREVLPLVEGGKGISVSNGESSGSWALAGGVGTFSGVNADDYDESGRALEQIYHGKTRKDRHEELIAYAIRGALAQARIARDICAGKGRIHMNILWEMAAAERILEQVLEQARGIIHGVTCGAGMPYRIAEITARHGIFYYPIVSSARAFRALWLRSYRKFPENLGGVVYEDPWRAGGHNGLSNSEDPYQPQPPYPRVVALRQMMKSFGLDSCPIFMAGGVWYLREWEDWIDNPEIGPLAFQFGTRPLLTCESPISDTWKRRLLSLSKDAVTLNRFSPTGFYSSAVKNRFLEELEQRSRRQFGFASSSTKDGAGNGSGWTPEREGYDDSDGGEEYTAVITLGVRKRRFYVRQSDLPLIEQCLAQGYDTPLKTPDHTMILVARDQAQQILTDQINCMGCLSACRFSNWAQGETGTTGRTPDPRSYCIQKTLQRVSHSDDCDDQLMFAGHNAYRFAQDPFYANGFIPTVRELVERIQTGD